MEQIIIEVFKGINLQKHQPIIDQFKDSTEGLQWSLNNMTNDQKIFAWFSLKILDHWVCEKPQQLPLQNLLQKLLETLQYYYMKGGSKDSLNKLSVLICAVSRWTFQGKTICSDVASLLSNEQTNGIAIHLFLIMAEEYRSVDKKFKVPSERSIAINQAFENESVEIVKLLIQQITMNKVEALNALTKYVGWIPTEWLVNVNFFRVIETAIQLPQMVKPSLECLLEYLQSNITIPTNQEFHSSLIHITLCLMKSPTVPAQQVLYLLMKIFTTSLTKVPFDDSLFRIPQALNEFLMAHINDFYAVSTCFETWNTFFDSEIAESLLVAEQFSQIAQDCTKIIMPLLFYSSYKEIGMLDISETDDEQSEFQIFIFTAYQVLMTLVDFQSVAVLPIILNAMNESFGRISKKQPQNYTDGDVYDIVTTATLFAYFHSNMLLHIESVQQLQNLYQPLLQILSLVPQIQNENVMMIVTSLNSAIRTLFSLLNDYETEETLQYMNQLLQLFIQISSNCQNADVSSKVIDLIFELILSTRPNIFNIQLVKEIMAKPIEFANQFGVDKKKYILSGIANVFVFPIPSENYTQEMFNQNIGPYTTFIQNAFLTPFVQYVQQGNVDEINNLCKIITMIVKDKDYFEVLTKQLIVQPFIPLLKDIIPQVLQNCNEECLSILLLLLTKFELSLGEVIQEDVILPLCSTLFMIFNGKIQMIIQQNNKILDKALVSFVKILHLYIKSLNKHHADKLTNQTINQLIMQPFTMITNTIFNELNENTSGQKIFKVALSLFFEISQVLFNQFVTNEQFTSVLQSLSLKIISSRDIELAKLMISALKEFNQETQYFNYPQFQQTYLPYSLELLEIIRKNEHSIEDITELLYLILTSDLNKYIQSLQIILQKFFQRHPQINEHQKQYTIQLFMKDTDYETFYDAVEYFINDMNCYLN